MDKNSGPIRANKFHLGNTCPYCQKIIQEGQSIAKCPACGSLNHEACWQQAGGCSSYHCDPRVRIKPKLEPGLVITSGELDRVRLEPKPVRPGGGQTARAFLPPKPEKRSRLALVSLVMAVLAIIGLWGVFTRSAGIMIFGIVLAIAGLVTGIIALVSINTSRKVYGSAPAGAGIIAACALILVYFIGINTISHSKVRDALNLQVLESRPSESQLAQLPPAKARALRANVVVLADHPGFLSQGVAQGSGVILKIEDQKAYILTNRHVIRSGAEKEGEQRSGAIDILFYDGEESRAVVEWLAPNEIDLAVISAPVLTKKLVEPMEMLTTIVPQGTKVFAVGNPQGLYWTYTEGVVSGLRTRRRDGLELEIYQTQTPINYGNSGGGLYNMSGRLIGVNTWTGDKAVSEGLSFTIASRSIFQLLGDNDQLRFLGPTVAADVREGKERD